MPDTTGTSEEEKSPDPEGDARSLRRRDALPRVDPGSGRSPGVQRFGVGLRVDLSPLSCLGADRTGQGRRVRKGLRGHGGTPTLKGRLGVERPRDPAGRPPWRLWGQQKDPGSLPTESFLPGSPTCLDGPKEGERLGTTPDSPESHTWEDRVRDPYNRH